jgi:hypothetical protein
MAYNGVERRNETKRFCEGHIALCEDMAIVKTTLLALDKRINGSLDDMKTHIGNSKGRNLAIIGAVVSIVLYLFNLSAEAGANKRQIEVNTQRWNSYMEGKMVK